MSDENWTTAALTDATLVANLLLHLRRTSPTEKTDNFPALPLRWLVRQPRSRPTVRSSSKHSADSPITPLSWSCATSASGGGLEESSSVTAARSKVIDASENTKSKKSRKKKTLAELRKDEILVLRESYDLKKKLASMRVTVEIERATNDRLKRLKLDYVSRSAKSVTFPVPDKENMVLSYSPISSHFLRIDGNSLGIPTKPQEDVMNRDNDFMLPDLNIPIEDQ